MDVLQQYLPVILLIFVRLSAFFVTAPVFSIRGVPNQVEIGLAAVMAFLSFSYVPTGGVIPMDGTFVLYVLKETIAGLLLGFVVHLFFYVLQIAGGLIDMQMGLALANVIDPQTGAYAPISGNFKNILAILYFLSINGHHMLLQGILTSYRWMPIDRIWFSFTGEKTLDLIVEAFVHMFVSGFLMAAPIVVALFLVDLSLGIIAKMVPQFHIFVIGLPLKIIAGFFVLLFVIPGFFIVLGSLFEQMFTAMLEMMKRLGGTA